MDPSRPLTFGRALSLAFSQLRALPPILVLFCASAVGVLGTVVALAAFVFQLRAERPYAAGAVALGLLTAWVIAQLLRALALGGAIGVAADRLAAQPPVEQRTFFAHAISLAQETVPYALVRVLLDLLVFGWRILAVIVGGWLYVHALVQRSGGGAGAAALSLALVGGLFLAGFVAIWVEVSLVRAVHHREPFTHALLEGLTVLLARPWIYVALALLTGALGFASELLLSSLVGVAPRAGDSLETFALVQGYGQLVSGLILALALTLFELVRIYALLALSLEDSGELPRPPGRGEVALHSTPVPFASAELIIDAEPVGPRR